MKLLQSSATLKKLLTSKSIGVTSIIEKIIPLPELYSSESFRVIAGNTYLGDNSKAKRELGYNPRPLEAGLKETLLREMQALGIKTSE